MFKSVQGGQTWFRDHDYSDTISAHVYTAKSMRACMEKRAAERLRSSWILHEIVSPISTHRESKNARERATCYTFPTNQVADGLGHGLTMQTPSRSFKVSPPFATFFVYLFTRHYSYKVFESAKQLLKRERCNK